MTSPVQRVHYGTKVWVSPTIEAIRSQECLCLHCGALDRTGKANCVVAAKLFEICKLYDVATPVTRCPDWVPEGAKS